MNANNDYARIARAIQYLDRHAERQPGLRELSAALHLSEFHLQRLFLRWAGISPKRFLQALTGRRAAELLHGGASVANAALDCGLSGTSRLHDLMVNLHAMTPAQFKSGGAGLTIRYGVHQTRFGAALAAATERGICMLQFTTAGGDPGARITARWPAATVRRDPAATRAAMATVFGRGWPENRRPVALHVGGSNFQLQVWRALLQIPPATCATYAGVAAAIGRPTAARAAATAIAGNPVAWVIPCHRVIRGTGVVGNYRWGAERKRAMLTWERCMQRRDAA
ncbi:MAG: methylated-DNA--[protein]-cysteine S-methyltransferase [Gammaproteobacteria bacterium]|nr:methylated-DNA--[protein]-cysteine S-methyltransferase [Gammaproteobacteria bacterium]MDD9799724.1 methylated-DNA--[protein]-cysteine S-methyltransferase [Gammaproteobacteria bacterium]MDD9815826.1 methylated-DNA--[protein]-cysteine S-methyltransferase [Gammaproteobacteria bacterium]MDD9850188.1 methylated-DNA--[protein]-cysteine S-methyltransferase [Gammaproteobacteria bacterium]MDD9870777.1 methylated-DNA--[protein]-cysteine S-methyltransferase [Gammaproteobacteria bacterium]